MMGVVCWHCVGVFGYSGWMILVPWGGWLVVQI